MPQITRTFCRICIASCGALVTVEGDQITDVRGDPDHPLSRGYLCPKGRALGDLHHHPDRLSGALVRRDGGLVAASIDDALDHAGAALARVIAEHGPDHIGFFTGSGGFMDPAAGLIARKLRRALGTDHNYTTATVDGIARVAVTSLMAATTALIPHVGPNCRLTLFVGSNPVVSHGQFTGFANPVEWLRDARRRGEVWVLDPRRTETARHADGYLGARPGTDPAVLAFLVRHVLARQTVPPTRAGELDRFDVLRAAVERFDAETAAAITGLDPAKLVQIAEAIDRAGQLAVVPGTGSTMSPAANLTEWLAWALMLVTGSVDTAEGVWFNPGYMTRLDERAALPATPKNLPTPVGRPGFINVGGEWPAASIPDEIAAGRLKALITIGGNAAVCLPDSDRLAHALRSLDALVVLELFPSETAALATHVFACPDQLERPDVPGMDIYLPARMGVFAPAAIDAPADRPPAWWTLAQLARRLGHEIIADPDATGTEEVLRQVARGIDFDELSACAGVPTVEQPLYGWIADRLPTGSWDVAPQVLVDELSRWPASQPRGSLVLTPRRQLRRENTRAYRDGESMDVWIHPDDAAANGVVDGAIVTLRSATGSLDVAARVTDSVVRGAVAAPHGWGEHNVNRLVSARDLDPLTGMPKLSGTIVEIEAVRP